MTLSNSPWRAAAALASCLPALAFAQHQPLEEVRVVGHPIDQSPEDLAQSVTVVGGETLNRIRGATLGETLSNQLGISASYFGAGASRPIVRGLAGARVRTLEDGIDSMDVSTVSVDHAVGIDPLIAEQIEIFRGPTTLIYGSGAVGGVVNTVTKRVPESAPDDGFEGAFELRGDTVSDDRSGAIALDGGGDRIAWHFDALSRDTGDYEIPEFAESARLRAEEEAEGEAHEEAAGILPNSDVETDGAAVGATWLGADGFLGVSVSRFEANYGVPGHAHEEEEGAEEEVVRIDLEQTRVDVKGGWLGLSDAVQAVNLRVGVNDYAHVELEGSEIGTRFENDAYEGRLEVMHSPWGQWSGAFGLQFANREFAAIGEEAVVPPVETQTYGLFVIEQRAYERWDLSAGARVETQTQKPEAGFRDVDGTASSVSLAAIRSLGNGLALAFNGAIAERLPVAEELYSNGPHLATGTVEIGDPELNAETSRHVDVAIRKSDGNLTWSITAFWTDFDDFIYLRDTGIADPDELLPIFEFDQRDARLTGVEAEVFTPLGEVGSGELDLRLFDYVRAKLDSGEYLPRMPPLRYGARLQFHDERFLAGLEATRHADQQDLAPFETPTDGYTMVNVDFNWQLETAGATTLDLFFRGTNLTDDDARRHTSFVKEFAPLPGRNFAVGIRARF
jgi:iron complex outermembrane recepter protein